MGEQAHGYHIKRQTTDDGQVIEVDLDGEKVVLTQDEFDLINDEAAGSAEFKAEVLNAATESAAEWDANRGPDSDLGKNIEAGTPTSDHSNDPA